MDQSKQACKQIRFVLTPDITGYKTEVRQGHQANCSGDQNFDPIRTQLENSRGGQCQRETMAYGKCRNQKHNLAKFLKCERSGDCQEEQLVIEGIEGNNVVPADFEIKKKIIQGV